MLNLVYHKSAPSRCYHPFHHVLDVTRSMAARMLVFHPILKCFQSLKFSRPNKPQSCNVSFIILKRPLFPIFFHLAVVLAMSPLRISNGFFLLLLPLLLLFLLLFLFLFFSFSFFTLKLFWLCFFQRVPIIKRVIFFFLPSSLILSLVNHNNAHYTEQISK